MTRKQFEEWVERICQKARTEEALGRIEIIMSGYTRRVIVVDLKTIDTGMSDRGDMAYEDDTAIAIAYARLRGFDVPEIKEEEFKRAKRGGTYYRILVAYDGAFAAKDKEDGSVNDYATAKVGNYFLTRERAEEVADKINTLLLMEKMHDTYCPDYKPDFNDGNTYKWCVQWISGVYKAVWVCCVYLPTDVYFATREIAENVADIFNNRDEGGDD